MWIAVPVGLWIFLMHQGTQALRCALSLRISSKRAPRSVGSWSGTFPLADTPCVNRVQVR